WKRCAGAVDELGHPVDPARREPSFAEEVCPVARPAPGIDRFAVDAIGPSGRELTIRWMHRAHRTEELDVFARALGVRELDRVSHWTSIRTARGSSSGMTPMRRRADAQT